MEVIHHFVGVQVFHRMIMTLKWPQKKSLPFNSQLNKIEILKTANFKQFQLEAIELLQTGKDVGIVQPTGSGKSLCYTVPALLNPGKITLVIEPVVAIIPPDGTYSGSVGRFDVLKSCKNVNLVVIDEAHKIFDRMASYRPAFDSLKKLQQLSCTLAAMLATLTSKQSKF